MRKGATLIQRLICEWPRGRRYTFAERVVEASVTTTFNEICSCSWKADSALRLCMNDPTLDRNREDRFLRSRTPTQRTHQGYRLRSTEARLLGKFQEAQKSSTFRRSLSNHRSRRRRYQHLLPPHEPRRFRNC